MMMRNHVAIWHYTLLFYFVVSLLFGLYAVDTGDYVYFALAALPITLLSILLSKGNLIDPRVWFSVFGWLYSFSNTVLAWGGQRSVDTNISFEAAYLNYIFYGTAIFSLWVFSFLLKKNTAAEKENYLENSARKLSLITALLCCYLLADAVIVFSSGLTSKRMIAAEGVGLPLIGVLANALFVAYSLYLLTFSNTNLKKFIGAVGFAVLLSYLFTGERDLIAKFVLCTSFALIYTNKIKKRIVYIYGFVFVLLFALMKDITSYILNRGDYEITKFDGVKWALFRGDWTSSGVNLELLLSSKYLIEQVPARLQFMFNDVVAGVLPFGSRLVESTGHWYANNFLYYSIGREVGGLGFSYVGSWYIYLGEAGVFIGAALYSFIVWFFYYKASSKKTLLAAYISFTALAIWSLRVGFHGLLTSAINQTLLPLLLIIIFLKYTNFKIK